MTQQRYTFAAPERLDSDALHAALASLVIPGYLGIAPDVEVIHVDFEEPISEEDRMRVAAVVAAHDGGPKRRTKAFGAIRQAVLDWLAVPGNAPAYAQRLAQAQAASIAAQLLHDPHLAARAGLLIDPTEPDV